MKVLPIQSLNPTELYFSMCLITKTPAFLIQYKTTYTSPFHCISCIITIAETNDIPWFFLLPMWLYFQAKIPGINYIIIQYISINTAWFAQFMTLDNFRVVCAISCLDCFMKYCNTPIPDHNNPFFQSSSNTKSIAPRFLTNKLLSIYKSTYNTPFTLFLYKGIGQHCLKRNLLSSKFSQHLCCSALLLVSDHAYFSPK